MSKILRIILYFSWNFDTYGVVVSLLLNIRLWNEKEIGVFLE
jgi:hypothetical protein